MFIKAKCLRRILAVGMLTGPCLKGGIGQGSSVSHMLYGKWGGLPNWVMPVHQEKIVSALGKQGGLLIKKGFLIDDVVGQTSGNGMAGGIQGYGAGSGWGPVPDFSDFKG